VLVLAWISTPEDAASGSHTQQPHQRHVGLLGCGFNFIEAVAAFHFGRCPNFDFAEKTWLNGVWFCVFKKWPSLAFEPIESRRSDSEAHDWLTSRAVVYKQGGSQFIMISKLTSSNKQTNQIDAFLYTSITRLEMVLAEKAREAARLKSGTPTERLEDSRADQPLDVFNRRWTPVSMDNPIWREYRGTLRSMKTELQKKRQQMSACRKCMTIFYPFFPADFHLHDASPAFKSALNSKAIDAATIKYADSGHIWNSFQYKALVGLAKEAGAYFEDECGVQYIKLIRIVRGHRSHKDRGYENVEFCENCEMDECPKYESQQRFRSETLAAGIFKLLNM
jgi:hypothetical protein